MRSGYWVVAIFATAWASAGMLATGYRPIAILLPALLSGALLFWAYRLPSTGQALDPHARTMIARWSLVEGAAIVVAINLLHRWHRTDAAFPVVAVIVGLHFLPLARGIPVRLYYLTGAALILIGLAGMLLPVDQRPLAIGLSAAATLWATAIYRLAQAQRRPDQSSGSAPVRT